MAHFTKYTRGAAQMTICHDRRDKDCKRKNIDTERTHLNYNLCDIGDESEKIERLIQESKRSGGYIRDNSKVIVACVITLPKDFPKNDVLEREFFNGCYKFLCEDFGKENMVSAWVHRDECQDHIHIKFCPVIEKEREIKNGEKKTVYSFDAKNAVNRTYLKNFHKRLENYLDDWLGFTPSVINGATKGGNKSIAQLKAETAQGEYVQKCVDVYESNKRKIAGFWDEYHELSASYWREYKRQKELIQKELWLLREGFYYEQKNIEQGLNVICNLSHGLLYALCKLLTALFMMIQNKDVYQQLERAESDLERLESIRRKVSNYQNNTKEKLKKEDVEEIETALHKWEQSVMLMNFKKEEEKKKRIDNDLER